VVDASDEAVQGGRATGFVFDAATPEALDVALQRAIDAFARPQRWMQLMGSAMTQDFSWDGAARNYLALYAEVTGDPARRQVVSARRG